MLRKNATPAQIQRQTRRRGHAPKSGHPWTNRPESSTARAGRLLAVAGAFAEDGAVQTAIDRANEAIQVLTLEKQRRQAIGLMRSDQ